MAERERYPTCLGHYLLLESVIVRGLGRLPYCPLLKPTMLMLHRPDHRLMGLKRNR